MTDLSSLAGKSGYSKPFALSASGFGLSQLAAYRFVAGVFAGLLIIYGLAFITAANNLLIR